MEKIRKYFKNDYGLKQYSFEFIKNKGYNLRFPTTFIKKSWVIKLEEELLKKLDDKPKNIQQFEDIMSLKDMLSFRGMRHLQNLPTRGQRTKTNAQTAKWLGKSKSKKKSKKK